MSKQNSLGSKTSESTIRSNNEDIKSDNLKILHETVRFSPSKRKITLHKRDNSVEKEPMLVSPNKKKMSERYKYHKQKKTLKKRHTLLKSSQQNQILMNKIIANFSEDDYGDTDEFENFEDDGLFNFFEKSNSGLSPIHQKSESEQILSNYAPFLNNKPNTSNKHRLNAPSQSHIPDLRPIFQNEQTLGQTGKLRTQLTMSPASISLTSITKEPPLMRPLSPPQFSQKRQQYSNKLEAIKAQQHQLKYPLGDNIPSEFEDSSDEVELSSQIDLPKKFLPSNIPRSTTISKPPELQVNEHVDTTLNNIIPESDHKLISESLTRFDSGYLTTKSLIGGDVSPKVSTPGVGSPSGSHKTYDFTSVREVSPPLLSQTGFISETNSQDNKTMINKTDQKRPVVDLKKSTVSKFDLIDDNDGGNDNDNDDDIESDIDAEATILKVEDFIKRKREELESLTNESFKLTGDILGDENNEVKADSSKKLSDISNSSIIDRNSNEQQHPRKDSLKRKRSDEELILKNYDIEDSPPQRKKAKLYFSPSRKDHDQVNDSKGLPDVQNHLSTKQLPSSKHGIIHLPKLSNIPISNTNISNHTGNSLDHYNLLKASDIADATNSSEKNASSTNSQSLISNRSKSNFHSLSQRTQTVSNEKDPFLSPNSGKLKKKVPVEKTISTANARLQSRLAKSTDNTVDPIVGSHSNDYSSSSKKLTMKQSIFPPTFKYQPSDPSEGEKQRLVSFKKRDTDWTKEQWMKLYNYVMTWFYFEKDNDDGTIGGNVPKLDINRVENEFGCSIKELNIRIKELQKLIEKKIELKNRDGKN